MENVKIFHKQKVYEDYRHIIVAGIFIVLGIIMLTGISNFPKNLLLFIGFICLSIISYKILKTTKPIIISSNSICLGKMVNGYQKIHINSDNIKTIELISESKKEDRINAMYSGGEVEIFSSYYCITLKNNQKIKFDNLYNKEMQLELKEWGRKKSVVVALNDPEVTIK